MLRDVGQRRLRRSLGSGSPGRTAKAVKIVYGRLDEAARPGELKSLNRIKEIGHPFLLSIERIEIVDGRLVIVTELAQGCLKDAVRRSAARPAWPASPATNCWATSAMRPTRSTFIHERHGLQHLDVKPENLLLVGEPRQGGRFRAAERPERVASRSSGGLTPTLLPARSASTGDPSRHSDQYSLAIVYQEMLTGAACRSADSTAAQLAAQHLHSPPMLAVLPPADQPVIARALAKNPDQRFTSCRAFANALVELDESKSQASRRVTPSGRHAFPRSRIAATEVLNSPVLGPGAIPAPARRPLLPKSAICRASLLGRRPFACGPPW